MKFKSQTILLIIILLLVSCYKVEKPEQPNNLLTENEMVVILVDMAMMSSAKGVNKKKLETSGVIPNAYIFKKHAIDSVRFSESNNYYAYDIKRYANIYTRVKDSLTLLRDYYEAIETKEREEKEKQDSINKIKFAKQDSIHDLKPKRVRVQALKLKTLKK